MSLTTYGTKIDLREIPQSARAALVVNTYRMLEPGQTMELLNDADPQPLYDQIQANWPAGFGWDTLQSGPEMWRVRVVRIAKAANGSQTCGCFATQDTSSSCLPMG